jgi:PAS domain S-box-containing protein
LFAEPTSSKTGQVKTVLTIEDEKNVRASFVYFLADLDYRVLEADNGITGLELYRQHRPDLILLDLRIPGRNGFECLKQLRQLNPELPIIVISGTDTSSDVVKALHLGAWDFILKPIIDLQVLEHSIEKAFERTRLRQENLAHQKQLEEKVEQRTQALKTTYLQLAESEKRYRSIYENLQDIYYETSLQGVILEISPSGDKDFNYQRSDLIGKNILSYYADAEDRQPFLQKIQQTGRVNDYEVRLIDKNGKVVSFSLNATLHRDATGQPSHISGILRNITQRKQAEDELRSSKQTLEALFNAAPLAIMAVDTDLRVTLWNPAAEEIFGWTREEIIGHPYPLALPGKEWEAVANLKGALAGDQFSGLELDRCRKNGRHVQISASTAPLRDKANLICGVIIIIEDISEKQRLRSEADRHSRLASLGELAAGVAHEINNPNGLVLLNLPTVRDFVLDAITLQQEISIEQPTLTLGGFKAKRAAEAFPRLMTELEDSARRIKQIVEDLKDFSRQEDRSQDEYFDLNRSAEKAQRLAANHLKKTTARFSSRLTEQLPRIKGSPQRIEQVIVNLLINACEALTNREQSISLSTGYHQDQQEVFLQVSDSGRGIEAEQLPHVTDPFFTTRRKEGGTGLGLSVSARIIKEHNGRLHFSSKPREGTVVSIVFPAE